MGVISSVFVRFSIMRAKEIGVFVVYFLCPLNITFDHLPALFLHGTCISPLTP